MHGLSAAQRFDTVNPSDLYSWIKEELTVQTHTMLDVGSGSGRDAFWFASIGHTVTAVEPSHVMREYAIKHHDHPNIKWTNDSLPQLVSLVDVTKKYSLIMVNAVWMFIPPESRKLAFERLLQLSEPNGLLIFSIQLNIEDQEHGKFVVNDKEMLFLASQYHLHVVVDEIDKDKMGRDITWQHLAFRRT